MTDRYATCRSLPPALFGFTLANRRCLSVGCWCATRRATMTRWGCCLRTPTAEPLSIVTWFVQRWQLEVTFEEARRHLGVETQRQWSDKAIARTTPLLLGLFSWVTLVAHALYTLQPTASPRQAAWYAKTRPTFSDALALVRQSLWTAYPTFRISREEPDILKIPKPLFETLISTLSYAA